MRIGYFAQEFPPVDPDLRLIDYMRSIAEYVLTPDGRLCASQMLERFLFPSAVHYTQLARLSGGEKRRESQTREEKGREIDGQIERNASDYIRLGELMAQKEENQKALEDAM